MQLLIITVGGTFLITRFIIKKSSFISSFAFNLNRLIFIYITTVFSLFEKSVIVSENVKCRTVKLLFSNEIKKIMRNLKF